MTQPSTISASAPIKSLGLQAGDTVVVYRVEDDLVTLVVDRPTKSAAPVKTAREFAERWAGKFPLPEQATDERLAHIIAKHVK